MTSGEPTEHIQTTQPPARKTSAEPWIASIENEFVHLEHEIEDIAKQPPPVLFLRVLKFDLPYIVMLSAAIFGIGYVSFTGQPAGVYWEILAPVYGAICIWAGWRHAQTKHDRVRLVWTQALHWAAVLVAMYVVYSPGVRTVANNNAAGISLMSVLALATFLAGVHAVSWQVCIIGVILALAVPAMAWIATSAMFIVVAALGVTFLVFVIASLWWTMHREKKRAVAA